VEIVCSTTHVTVGDEHRREADIAGCSRVGLYMCGLVGHLRMSGSVGYLTARIRNNTGKGVVIPRQYDDIPARWKRDRFWSTVDHCNRLEYVTGRISFLYLVSVNEKVDKEWGRFLFICPNGRRACYYKVEERSWKSQCGIRRRRGGRRGLICNI